jgi:hypothetical protein
LGTDFFIDAKKGGIGGGGVYVILEELLSPRKAKKKTTLTYLASFQPQKSPCPKLPLRL